MGAAKLLYGYDSVTAAWIPMLVDATGKLKVSGGTTIIKKTADETVNNSNVLQDDAELKLTVGANEVWVFTIYLPYYATATPDLKFGLTLPAGAIVRWGGHSEEHQWYRTEADTVFCAGSDTIPERGDSIDGYIAVGGTGGTLQFTWAQNTATAVDTIVRKGAALIAWQIV